jgi:hypothetical protein
LIFERNAEGAEGFSTATVATNRFIGGGDFLSKLGHRSAPLRRNLPVESAEIAMLEIDRIQTQSHHAHCARWLFVFQASLSPMAGHI